MGMPRIEGRQSWEKMDIETKKANEFCYSFAIVIRKKNIIRMAEYLAKIFVLP
jgi:hypothetical protein